MSIENKRYRYINYDKVSSEDRDGAINGYYCEIYFPGPNQDSVTCGPDRVEIIIDEWITKFGNPQFLDIQVSSTLEGDTFNRDCLIQIVDELIHTFPVGLQGEVMVYKGCDKLEEVKKVFAKWGIKYVLIDKTNLNDVLF